MGIAFWEEKVLEEQKKKINHLYLQINKGVISDELKHLRKAESRPRSIDKETYTIQMGSLKNFDVEMQSSERGEFAIKKLKKLK